MSKTVSSVSREAKDSFEILTSQFKPAEGRPSEAQPPKVEEKKPEVQPPTAQSQPPATEPPATEPPQVSVVIAGAVSEEEAKKAEQERLLRLEVEKKLLEEFGVRDRDELGYRLSQPQLTYADKSVELFNSYMAATEGKGSPEKFAKLVNLDPASMSEEDAIIEMIVMQNPGINVQTARAIVAKDYHVEEEASEIDKQSILGKKSMKANEARNYLAAEKAKIQETGNSEAAREAVKQRADQLKEARKQWAESAQAVAQAYPGISLSVQQGEKKIELVQYVPSEKDRQMISDSIDGVLEQKGPFWDRYINRETGVMDQGKFAEDMIFLENKDKIFQALIQNSQQKSLRDFLEQNAKNTNLGGGGGAGVYVPPAPQTGDLKNFMRKAGGF